MMGEVKVLSHYGLHDVCVGRNDFKVGDAVLTLNPYFGSTLLKISELIKKDADCFAVFNSGGFFRLSGLRPATDQEQQANTRM